MDLIHKLLNPEGLINRSNEFRRNLSAVKNSIKCADISWYPYDSLINLYPVEELLKQTRLTLQQLTGATGPVLDIGCADGDLAFFLESLGLTVHAIDNPPTNFNRMSGVHGLRSALKSRVTLWECDLDARFELPETRFTVAFFLGTMYHLKNPFFLLELLAQRVQYCFLSTRVAQFTPDHKVVLRDIPVAYLLDAGEANNDATNYWIFTMAALRRLIRRAGWEVCAEVNSGDTRTSDPVLSEKDERAFLLLRSRENP